MISQHVNGDQWRYNSRKNEEMEPKQKQHPTVDTSGESEVAQSCPTLSDPMDCSLPAPPSMGCSGQRFWSGVPFPAPEDLPDPGIGPRSACIAVRRFIL